MGIDFLFLLMINKQHKIVNQTLETNNFKYNSQDFLKFCIIIKL